jgi:acetyl esterase/lipase
MVAALAVCALIAPASAGAASSVHVIRDVRVPTADGDSITVDVWTARRSGVRRASQLRPVALLVHGGGWHSGDKRQWEESRWAQRLSRRGWLVINANYRLACTARVSEREAARRDSRLCGHAMRTSIADVRSALRFTADRARNWGGDQGRIVLFGASAGGQLAMLAGSDADRPRGVRAVIAIGPPTNLTWVGRRPELPLFASARQSIGCDLAACPSAWQAASPAANIRRGITPPTWIFNAGGDPITPIEPIRRYVELLQSRGVATHLLTPVDPAATCHGPIPCADVPLVGTSGDMFEHAMSWLEPRTR